MSKQFTDYYGVHMKFDEFPKFGILSSVKAVTTGTNIAGPFAGSLMSEMGAQVIQIEHPLYPCGTRGTYAYAQDHRNGFSVALDTHSKRGMEVFKKILAWADVWVESGRPGTYARLGLTDEYIWENINPRLAIVHVSGYGQYGPDKNKAAYDVSGQAMGGYMYMNGSSPTAAPLKVNPYLSDYATALNACICALSLVIHARDSGEGDSADISQYETMFRLLGGYPADWFNRGYPKAGEPVRWRTGNVSDQAAGFSFYDCKDGGTIFIGCVGAGNVKRGFPLFGLPLPGTTDPDIYENFSGCLITLPVGQRIEAAIKKFCSERTVDEVEAELNAHGIPNQKAYGPEDILKDAQYAAREDIITWTDGVYGEMKGIGLVNKFKRNPCKLVAPAPTLGEHNLEVFRTLGVDDAMVDEMYEAGEFACMDPKETAERWRLKEWQFFWRPDQAEKLGL
ncbi:MAG: CoA transferase [Oscillospiraceae bacterium]|nr:CoA transferase [Oscillospiraceae bacterium]